MRRLLSMLSLVVAVSAVSVPSYALNEGDMNKPTTGEVTTLMPKELKGIDIADRRGEKAAADVELTNHAGKKVLFGDYFKGEGKGEKPVVVVLGYYTCPMLCSLILNSTLDALKEVDLNVGEDFEVVVVSFKADETADLAAKKRANYIKAYGRDGSEAGWHFHVGSETEVRRLADSLGYAYRWDEKAEQFAHSSGIFVLSPDAMISRVLYGATFRAQDIKFSLIDASNGKVGTPMDKILLSCFSYTSDGQRYGVYIWGVMRLTGVLTILFLAIFLTILWRRDLSRRAPVDQ